MTTRQSAATNQTILLPDGRKLGFAEYGTPDGKPVLFFHGSPGSSHIHEDMAETAKHRGIRLIAVDRPGYGLSEPKSDRTLLDWADDIAALTEALGLSQFAIAAFSGGTPYALACAPKLSDRVSKMALVGSFAPLSIPGVTTGMSHAVSGLFTLAQTNTAELRATFTALAPDATALAAAMSATLPEWDKNVFVKRAAEFETEYTRTLLGGVEGVASDFALLANEWGFTPAGNAAEIHLWSGTEDQNTPPAMTHYLASVLPNSHTHVLPGEGHLSLYLHWAEILEQLV